MFDEASNQCESTCKELEIDKDCIAEPACQWSTILMICNKKCQYRRRSVSTAGPTSRRAMRILNASGTTHK